MLRNKSALPVLQKTYDESYLTCSTAVYYESQGDESEAMRCWKLALEQIYNHQANKVIPNYTPRSETEKALIDSLCELELQCKERIDLLEALRLSRQESVSAQKQEGESSGCRPNKLPDRLGYEMPVVKEWIGNGTIPAITYTQLSRPELPRGLPGLISTPSQMRGLDGVSDTSTSGLDTPSNRPQLPPRISTPEPRNSRSSSPEKHTLRTTLRSSRRGDKSSRPSQSLRTSLTKSSERPGASKAATLAWTTLGPREKPKSPAHASALASAPTLENQRSHERLRKSYWDSHSRRLVSPRLVPSSPRTSSEGTTRLLDVPSSFSVSAASSALTSLTVKDVPQLMSLDSMRTPTKASRNKMESVGFPFNDLPLSDGTRKNSLERPSGRRAFTLNHDVPSGISEAHDSTRARASFDRREGQIPKKSSASSIDDIDIRGHKESRRRRHEQALREASLDVESRHLSSREGVAENDTEATAVPWKKQKAWILRRLPPDVDEHASKQILNEIVQHGDEVHWSDVAGLEIAKNALRETVIYPFLRPDLFMGLREPAKGMLLFGPPGTGKTMLARAVATESKSTFFSISASSLTSKYLGESEKLVRALFALAKLLAPSIIFVDEIDSLLSQRCDSGEHEASRRIKTEFLIQWSDLQRAAAGREVAASDRGDANRVLVLAATNLPWAIDEAARRRFVRRQYIPLPEAETRKTQLKTLLGQQKHGLIERDIENLVEMTDGFSGSDITALAKDAAMGPLRSLGEALLSTSMDEIRPIDFSDFVASLVTIRPSVSQAGLKEYEDWAREFGERGG